MDCRGDRHTTYLLRNLCSLLSTVLPISRTVCMVVDKVANIEVDLVVVKHTVLEIGKTVESNEEKFVNG